MKKVVERLGAVLLLGVAGGLATAGGVGAQAPSQKEPLFRTSTDQVSLNVTVVDRQRRLVGDLVQDDFQIFEDGKPRAIEVFSNEVRPITVAVLLDTSLSMTDKIPLLKQAAENFVLKLNPDDAVVIGNFDDKVKVGTEFTSDPRRLRQDIEDIDYGNGTHLYDALLVGLDRLRPIEGRRVVLVFTDGRDEGSDASAGKVVERARTDETMVYAIGFRGRVFAPGFHSGPPTREAAPDAVLKRLADETGGGYFELRATDDFLPTFTRVAEELHSQYLIGFTPSTLADGKWHKVEVRVARADAVARTRKGYYAVKGRAVSTSALPGPAPRH